MVQVDEQPQMQAILLYENKCKEKRQSAVEDIFKDVDANNDVVYTEEYSSSESLSSNSEEEKLL